jgi:hypothetical protein
MLYHESFSLLSLFIRNANNWIVIVNKSNNKYDLLDYRRVFIFWSAVLCNNILMKKGYFLSGFYYHYHTKMFSVVLLSVLASVGAFSPITSRFMSRNSMKMADIVDTVKFLCF